MFNTLSGAVTSRRALLRGAAATAATAVVGTVLAACGGSSATDTPKPVATTAGTAAPAASTAATTAGTSASATKAPSAASTSAPATTGSAVAGAPTVAKSFSGKLTAWGIVSFTKDGDNLLGQQMADWGKANNVSVEYVPLDGSTYDAKVAGAIETGAIPDVVMLSGTNTIYYAAQNRLVDLTDVYNDVKGSRRRDVRATAAVCHLEWQGVFDPDAGGPLRHLCAPRSH